MARAAAGGFPPPAAMPSGLSSQLSLDRRRVLAGMAALPLAASAWPRRLAAAAATSPTDVVLAPGLTRLFHEASEKGVVAFASGEGRRAIVSDFDRAMVAFPPASTFKIPNTVIALETGVAQSLDDPVFKWDGEVRSIGGKPVEAWNRDQTLREAFRNSTVWVYQEVARKVGPERMARLVEAFDYGNRRVGEIDRFWLTGPLAISALGEIDFLGRLHARKLPVSARAQALTREAMVLETTDSHVLSGKTGWAFEHKIGWFVGWIEAQGRARPFALNLDVAGPGSLAARTEILKKAARQIGLL
ncbi:class D beta-lactamase [Hyphomicrobium sp. CS1GBMeth3]|uniref:class D beta-lactamase n=1 Tax=Hyphomicrobium sp. CS1GBMeth3 TaxID=1892845 RepID=UPI000B1F24EC|nr:class D beta-lactamase [Hyphomicrobium sp. CS1GBMeth3]